MALTYGFCLGEQGSLTPSSEFAETFRALIGDGVCPFGSRFELTADDTMYLTIGTGFALVAGYWLKVDEATPIRVSPSHNNYDRYDAVVVRLTKSLRKVELLVAEGIPAGVPQEYSPLRTEDIYEIVLYNVFVGMGVSSIGLSKVEDVRTNTSLCGYVMPMDQVASGVIRVYEYLMGNGVDQKVQDILLEAQRIQKKAQAQIGVVENRVSQTLKSMEAAMSAASVSPLVGEISQLHEDLVPPDYLLCDGSTIPSKYSDLISLIGPTLPNIPLPDSRFKTWIYAGKPKS